MTSALAGWPALLAATGAVLPWGSVLAAGGAALALAGLPAVLPPQGDGALLALGVLVLACGTAVAGEDPPSAAAGAVPVGGRRRLLARLLLVLPVSAAVLGGVCAVAAASGAPPGAGVVWLWVALTAVATAVGATAARGASGVPGPVAAAAVLGGGAALASVVPGSVAGLAPWDTTAERVAWALALAAVLALRATRDPAARPAGQAWARAR